MKILITGASGMVGQNIVNHNKAAQYSILAPSSAELNLLHFDQVITYLQLHKPDAVIHAAGLVGGIHANIANPVSFLVINTDIGRNITMASKECGISKFLNIASSCMYPRNAENPLTENLILKGELEPTNEGYALAKIFATRLCEYIKIENSDWNYKTIIPSNLYGKHDKFSPEHSHLVPAIIKKVYDAKLANQKTVEIWGDGLAKREFMYAEDLADFVYFSLENFEKLPQNCNVGLGKDFTINEYYQIVAELLGFKGKFIHDLSKPTGMKQKLMDSSKALSLGWKPNHTLKQGLEKTIEYYKTEFKNE